MSCDYRELLVWRECTYVIAPFYPPPSPFAAVNSSRFGLEVMQRSIDDTTAEIFSRAPTLHPKIKQIEPSNIKLTSALQLEREAKSQKALAIIFIMFDSAGVASN